MFMRNASLLLVLGSVFSAVSIAQQGPGLGQELMADQIAAVDYTVMPNGDGLPDGSGNAAGGRDVYLKNCLACHGEDGAGGVNDVLSGGHGSIKGPNPQKTVGSYWPYATTIFDYVRRAMPLQSPGILSDDEIYAVTAYLLYINDIIAEDAEMNADSLPNVKMPNRDKFVWGYTPK